MNALVVALAGSVLIVLSGADSVVPWASASAMETGAIAGVGFGCPS